VQVERIFSEMDNEKYQRERFYEASRAFNQALTVEDVSRVAIDAVRKVADVELAAVAVSIADADGMMRIQAVDSRLGAKEDAQLKELLGRTFAANDGLVGAAIKARHPLPHDTARATSQWIFDRHNDVAIEHVKVLPLLWKNLGVGALVLGARREAFLPLDLLD